MARVTDARAAGERVEALIAELRARAGSQAGDVAEELVGCLVELYGAGLAAIVAILGAAAGMAGSWRAQMNLRASCVFLDMHPLNKPEVLIFQAQNKFDAAGKLTDDVARGLIRDLMAALLAWARKIGSAS